MGYIKKLKNNELVGGTDKTTIYPVTSTKAVFEEITEGNESSFKSQKTINGEHDGRIKGLEEEMPDTVKSITINGGQRVNRVDENGNVDLTIYSDGGQDYEGLTEVVADLRDIVGENPEEPQSGTLLERVDTLENAVGTGGSVDQRISNAIGNINAEHSDIDPTDHIQYQIIQSNGEITDLTIQGVDIASADALEALRQTYEGLSRTDIIIQNTAPATGNEGIIYRVTGETTYTDYMFYNGQRYTMATYDIGNLDPQVSYYTCATLAATPAKAATGTDASAYALTLGGHFKVEMDEANTATSGVTLQVGSAAAKELMYNGATVNAENTWEAGEVIAVYYYNNKYWASNAQGGGGKAEKIKYDNSQSGLDAENVQGALDDMNFFKENEYFDINTVKANNTSSTYYLVTIDKENETVTVTTKIKINYDDIGGGILGDFLEIGKTYTFAFDYNNEVSNARIKKGSYTSNPLSIGEGHLSFTTVNTSGSLLVSLPKNTLANKSCTLSNISITNIEHVKDVVTRHEEKLSIIDSNIDELNNSVVSEPLSIDFTSMTRNKAIVSPTTKNWRADNNTDYWHYYFERASDMKSISIQGNASESSYITFLKSYNYEGTPTGTPDYCDGYTGPVGFLSSATPNSKVVDIPDDCSYIIVNERYNGGVQLPAAVYVCRDLKSSVKYKDNTISTFNIPMEVGYISSSTGSNSPYSKDATADNEYAYATTDGKFNQWRNVGMIEVSDGNYTLSFDKGDTCIINYYNSLRELIKRNIVDIENGSVLIGSDGAKYIRIEVYTKSETYEQDNTLEAMYEPKVSISGIFPNGFKIAKLKKQLTQEADNIVTPVWIENTFASIERTQQMQDNGEWHIDFGRISLPANYDPDGEPVRLIIYSHGGSARYNPVFADTEGIYYASTGQWEKTIHINPTLFLAEGYAVMDMDACFCIFNTKDIDGVRVQGGKQTANCYKAAYDFVVKNYNIRTDGVLLGGISFGGNRSLQLIAWSNIPILAAALHSPYVGEHKHWFSGHRKTLARHAGFTNYDDVSAGNLNAEQLEIMEENYPKLLRTSPMLAMCHPSKEEFFATKTVDIGGKSVEVSLLNGYYNFGIYTVSTWAAHIPVPIKMWGGTADTTAQIDEHAEILYNVGINGGSDIILRIVNGAKHIPTLGGNIITIPTYVTKYGQTLTNVSLIYAETVAYWRRYEQD